LTETLVNEVRHVFPVMTYDIDFAGVLSNLAYVRWLEDLRILFAEQALPLGAALARGIAPALLRTEIDTLAPVRFPDQVEGRLWRLA
jgi:acyl-CoA thioester hydrolase